MAQSVGKIKVGVELDLKRFNTQLKQMNKRMSAFASRMNRIKLAPGAGGRKTGLGGLADDAKKTSTGLDGASKSSKGFIANLKSMKTVIGGIIALLFVKTILGWADALRKAGAEAARFSQISQGFEAIQGTVASSTVLMNKLRKASAATIDELTLKRSANRATLLGIAPENLEKLLAGSRTIAKATGESISFLFESITLGIGRQSRLLLDNLGIIVRAGESYLTYSKKVGKAVDALSLAERRIAFASAAMKGLEDRVRSIGEIEDNLVQTQERLNASFTNMKLAFGAAFSEGGQLEGVLQTMIDLLDRAVDDGTVKQFGQDLSDAFTGLAGFIGDMDRLARSIGTVVTAIGQFRQFMGAGGEVPTAPNPQNAPLSVSEQIRGTAPAMGTVTGTGIPTGPVRGLSLGPKGSVVSEPSHFGRPGEGLAQVLAEQADKLADHNIEMAIIDKKLKEIGNIPFPGFEKVAKTTADFIPSDVHKLTGGGARTLGLPTPGAVGAEGGVPEFDVFKRSALEVAAAMDRMKISIAFDFVGAIDNAAASLISLADGTKSMRDALQGISTNLGQVFARQAGKALINPEGGLLKKPVESLSGKLGGLLGGGGIAQSIGSFMTMGALGGLFSLFGRKKDKKPEDQREKMIETLQGIKAEVTEHKELAKDWFGFDGSQVAFLATSQTGARFSTAQRAF